MLTRAEIADIIDAARKDPRYCTEVNHLCSMVRIRLEEGGMLTSNNFAQVTSRIQSALGDYVYAGSYLSTEGLIPRGTDYTNSVYTVAVNKLWDDLIEELRTPYKPTRART